MLLQLPLTQQALAQEQQRKWVEELFDGSIMLLDVCSTAKDALLQTKECTQELQSILRRRRGVEGLGDEVRKLRASDATSTSSSISRKLNGFRDLYDCVDKLLQLPFSQQALAQKQHKELVDELLDGSLWLLDLCSTAKDVVLQTKESTNELQSILRRRTGEVELSEQRVKLRFSFLLSSSQDEESPRVHKNNGQNKQLVKFEPVRIPLVSKLKNNKLSLCKNSNVIHMDACMNEARLVASKSASTSSSLNCKLGTLQDLHDCIDKLLRLPLTQQILAQEQQREYVDELLNASLRLLDVCTTSNADSRIILRHQSTNSSHFSILWQDVSKSHPITSEVDEHLSRLAASESASTSSSLNCKLGILQDLHDCVDKLLRLPLTQQILAQEQQREYVDELLNASLTLLDVCTTAKDALFQVKECTLELQSILRRKQGATTGLRASEAASTFSSLSHKLNGLQDLHDCTDRLLQLPLTQQALAKEQQRKYVDELLDGSLRLLDTCSTAKDALSQTKECTQELQSILRRRQGVETGLTIK
ncbi:Protein BPS1, partial [Theobroma cacao]